MFRKEPRPTIENADTPTPHRVAKLVWFLIIVTFLPMVVFETALMTLTVVVKMLTYNLTYECQGVPEEWLVDHPFKTDNLPKTISEGGELILFAPTIEGYDFVEWKTQKNLFGPIEYNTFKSGETYKFSATHLGTSFVIIGVYTEEAGLIEDESLLQSIYYWGVK